MVVNDISWQDNGTKYVCISKEDSKVQDELTNAFDDFSTTLKLKPIEGKLDHQLWNWSLLKVSWISCLLNTFDFLKYFVFCLFFFVLFCFLFCFCFACLLFVCFALFCVWYLSVLLFLCSLFFFFRGGGPILFGKVYFRSQIMEHPSFGE